MVLTDDVVVLIKAEKQMFKFSLKKENNPFYLAETETIKVIATKEALSQRHDLQSIAKIQTQSRHQTTASLR